MTNKRRLSADESQFIQRMGQLAQESGITRIAGQIWAALVISAGPVSACDLIEQLQISKGSLSTNVRLLEMLDIVERRSMPGERQDFFAIRTNTYSALIESQIKRFDKSEAVVAEARASIKGKAAQQQLADLELFYSLYRKSLQDLLRAMESRKK